MFRPIGWPSSFDSQIVHNEKELRQPVCMFFQFLYIRYVIFGRTPEIETASVESNTASNKFNGSLILSKLRKVFKYRLVAVHSYS